MGKEQNFNLMMASKLGPGDHQKKSQLMAQISALEDENLVLQQMVVDLQEEIRQLKTTGSTNKSTVTDNETPDGNITWFARARKTLLVE